MAVLNISYLSHRFMYLCYTYATPRLLGSSKPKRATTPNFDAGLREHRDLTSSSCLLSVVPICKLLLLLDVP